MSLILTQHSLTVSQVSPGQWITSVLQGSGTLPCKLPCEIYRVSQSILGSNTILRNFDIILKRASVIWTAQFREDQFMVVADPGINCQIEFISDLQVGDIVHESGSALPYLTPNYGKVAAKKFNPNGIIEIRFDGAPKAVQYFKESIAVITKRVSQPVPVSYKKQPVDMSRYPHTCYQCGSPAYHGINTDCSNSRCSNGRP